MKRLDAANDNDAGKQIARTRQIWQPRLRRALSEDDYCPEKLAALNRLELTVPVVSCHHVSHAVCDPIDSRHQFSKICPDFSKFSTVIF